MKQERKKALIYMMISTFSFAIMGAIVKYLNEIPVVEKVFFRNLISLIIAFIIIKKGKTPLFGNRTSQKFLLLR